MIYSAIVLLPLAGALIAGLFGRVLGLWAALSAAELVGFGIGAKAFAGMLKRFVADDNAEVPFEMAALSLARSLTACTRTASP